jgi:hypothetical protein
LGQRSAESRHHHANAPADTCPICHLSHQAIAPAPATQRPFAIVIVAGLISRLFLGFFVNPVLYEMVAREGDVLQV